MLVFFVTDRLVLLEEELIQERIHEQKKLAKEEVKLKREFEREQRLVRKVTQERQVQYNTSK